MVSFSGYLQKLKLELYVDGIKLATKCINPGNNTATFLLGAMYDSATPEMPRNYFDGWMEELRIWNTALTQNSKFMMNQRVKTMPELQKEKYYQ